MAETQRPNRGERVARPNVAGVPVDKGVTLSNNIKIAQSSSIGLVYGEYGVGKTYLSGTVQEVVRLMEVPELELPEGWQVIQTTLFVNAEKGDLGLPKEYHDIVVKSVSDWDGICKTYDFMKNHCAAAEKLNTTKLIQLQEKYLGKAATEMKILFIFKAIVFDSLTEIQKLCINDIRSIDETTGLDDDLTGMRIQDWGTALDKILMLIRYYRDFIPITKVFIVQTLTETDDRGKNFYRPSLQGQARDLIIGYFDWCGYYTMMVDKNGKAARRLYLSPVGPFKAKNRFESFEGSSIDDPRMKDILKYKIKVEQETTNRRFSF